MSEATAALIESEVALQGLFPNTFTIDGSDTAHACIFARTRVSKSISTSGMRGSATAAMSFLKSVDYTPASGDRVTINGEEWVVEMTEDGHVKWELSLISDDE